MDSSFKRFSAVALIFLSAILGRAAVFNAFDRGWWDSTGFHSSGDSVNSPSKNTFTGQSTGTIRYNSFFSFDLSGLNGLVTSGVLKLELEGYFGNDASEAFTVYDVSTAVSTLNASGAGQMGIFNDLQSGDTYGSGVATAALVGSVLNITLSSDAIADINAANSGLFAVGVHVNQITVPNGDEGVRWSLGDEARTHQLDLEVVPEASTSIAAALLLLPITAAALRKLRKFRA